MKCPQCGIEIEKLENVIDHMVCFDSSEIPMGHLIFKAEEPKPKTKVWSVWNYVTRELIGKVAWGSSWRKYVFFTYGDMMFDEGCMRHLADFVELQTRIHKQRRSDGGIGSKTGQ